MFLYKADDFLICFDTGFNEDSIKKEFDRLGFDPKNVRYIFLTHSDRDHTGGLNLFKNAKLYLSADEEQMIRKKHRGFLGLATIDRSTKYILRSKMGTLFKLEKRE